jgi:outer membrane receptor protein involved in Fe transport
MLGIGKNLHRASVALAMLLMLPAERCIAQSAAASEALPTVEVVATSPLGAATNTLNVPTEVQSIDSTQIEALDQDVITEDMARRVPGVATTDEIGSPLAQSLTAARRLRPCRAHPKVSPSIKTAFASTKPMATS